MVNKNNITKLSLLEKVKIFDFLFCNTLIINTNFYKKYFL